MESVATFAGLYPFVRVLLDDQDEDAPAYSNEMLDRAMRLALLREEDVEEDPAGSFSPALSTKIDVLRVSVRTALSMLSPAADGLSYRTPVVSVSRPSQREGHFRYLEGLLEVAVNGELADVEAYSDVDAASEAASTRTAAFKQMAAGLT
jgi:hypothetical protein